jgi:hypothetical protein
MMSNVGHSVVMMGSVPEGFQSGKMSRVTSGAKEAM